MAKILVVDDSGYARRLLRQTLEPLGHEVVEAGSGMAGLEAYAVHAPDVVLLDLTMEDVGGLEVLARLREIDPGARVIVVSADIHRPAAEVFAYATDPTRFSEWQQGVIDGHMDSAGDPVVGARCPTPGVSVEGIGSRPPRSSP